MQRHASDQHDRGEQRERSEFLLELGAFDLIVDRRDMRERIGQLLRLLMQQPALS